jgi:hypothetical protein
MLTINDEPAGTGVTVLALPGTTEAYPVGAFCPLGSHCPLHDALYEAGLGDIYRVHPQGHHYYRVQGHWFPIYPVGMRSLGGPDVLKVYCEKPDYARQVFSEAAVIKSRAEALGQLERLASLVYRPTLWDHLCED